MVTCIRVILVLAALSSIGIFTQAKSAIHEIESLLFGLIAVLCLCTLAVLQALEKIQRALPWTEDQGREAQTLREHWRGE